MPKSNGIQTKNKKKIYLDYASATPMDEAVLKNLQKILKGDYANPSALHDLGVKAKKFLEESRRGVAEILGAHSNEIIFTSGATEANNLAIMGAVDGKPGKIPHIITTNIEHASVLEACRHLEKTKQAEVTYIGVEKSGIVDPRKIKKALKPNTVLVSVMYANNEIGYIEPISEIAKEIRHFNKINSSKILFHTDATQAMNYLPTKVEKLGVDLMSFNGAKIYGPKGVGVLYIKRNTPIKKIIYGGDQEFSFRPGTENVALVSGLALALKITEKMKEKEAKRLTKLRDYFFRKLEHSDILKNVGMFINGDLKNRLPNNVNITIPKIPSDLLVIELSAKGIMVSSKSACKSSRAEGSYVTNALHPELDPEIGGVRFSLGRQTTKKDINNTVKALNAILQKLGKWYH